MRLFELRKKNNLSQKDVAKSLFISQTCYSSYETGRTEPNIEMLYKIADFYRVSVDYIIGRENDDESNLTDAQKNTIIAIKKLNQENLNIIHNETMKLLDSQDD